MDISVSEGFSENEHLARLFLQHVHYVAASRVTSLEGLQILSWNADLISVNKDVRRHMEYLCNERQVDLCYTPVYVMKGLKCSFLNTRSLHRHIRSFQMNHNLCSADVVFLAETRLTASDPSDSYQIQGFIIACRNDQDWNEDSRPSHGIICYVKDTIRVLEIHKRSCEVFEAIFVCLQHTRLPIPVQLIGIYVAPKCKYTQLIHELDELMRNTDDTCDTILFGDFNMKSVSGMHHGYSRKLEQHMKISLASTRSYSKTHQIIHHYLICASPRLMCRQVLYRTSGQITELFQQHCNLYDTYDNKKVLSILLSYMINTLHYGTTPHVLVNDLTMHNM